MDEKINIIYKNTVFKATLSVSCMTFLNFSY